MTCSIPLRCLICGLGLMLVAGCSSVPRSSVASRDNAADRVGAEALEEDDAPIKTAQHETTAATEEDGPPSQPGVSSPAKSRKKLTGWLKKDEPKTAAIPLDRTDKLKQDDDSAVEEDSGFWKHNADNSATLAASKSPSKSNLQTADADDLTSESKNPFDP